MDRIEEYKRQVDASWEDQINFLKNALNEFFIPDLVDLIIKYDQYRPVEEEKFGLRSYGYVNPNDQKEGLWISYYENGNKFAEGQYHEDRQESPWIFYNHDGTENFRSTFSSR